jgi:deoxyribose-phosphate aldolase
MEAIASMIDHTLLKPEATQQDIGHICEEARQYSFASVCVNPCWVPLVCEQLQGSKVRVCTTIGFPLGANQTRIKVAEADLALTQGAREIDMVQNVGALRSGDLDLVRQEIKELAELTHINGGVLKVILETSLLTEDEKVIACTVAMEENADFVKTSTGFSSGGATKADVQLMRRVVGSKLGVKASGGVRNFASFQGMVAAGASRIGTSSGVAILKEAADSQSACGPGTNIGPGREAAGPPLDSY